MDDRLRHDVAEALETDPEVLPFLPELLADLEGLGGDPDAVVDILRPLDLPPETRVLDLGCGKGAISIALAKRFGFSITGIDGLAGFIDAAKSEAERHGVAQLCDFRTGDLRDALNPEKPYDVVVLIAVGRILGDPRETIGQIRSAVRPGGYIVVDDGFLAEGHTVDRDNYEGYLAHAETIAAMEAFGDRIVSEIRPSVEEIETENEENNRCIQARAKALVQRHPEAAPAIQAYVDRQIEECDILENDFISALWLLKRG